MFLKQHSLGKKPTNQYMQMFIDVGAIYWYLNNAILSLNRIIFLLAKTTNLFKVVYKHTLL